MVKIYTDRDLFLSVKPQRISQVENTLVNQDQILSTLLRFSANHDSREELTGALRSSNF